MNAKEKINKAKEALETMHKQSLMPNGEYLTLRSNLNGEEAEGIAERILAVYNTFKTMPKTYETDGQKEKTAYLHYFKNSHDFYIYEKDQIEDEQIQAFGLTKCNGESEIGYISLVELTGIGVELDLYWTPQVV